MNDLDAAVEKAEGYEHLGAIGTNVVSTEKPWCLSGCNDWWRKGAETICGGCYGFPRAYSTEWALAGPIIEREGIRLLPPEPEHPGWKASTQLRPIRHPGDAPTWGAEGPTPLIAAMRAYTASKRWREVCQQSVEVSHETP